MPMPNPHLGRPEFYIAVYSSRGVGLCLKNPPPPSLPFVVGHAYMLCVAPVLWPAQRGWPCLWLQYIIIAPSFLEACYPPYPTQPYMNLHKGHVSGDVGEYIA